MRIRRSTPSSISPSSLSSCSSSSATCLSSSPHSTISSHSLSSSSNSTSSFFSLSPNQRCQGLDLLVKAVYHVAGSVVGVPYIQRRVIRRRKPAIRFSSFLIGLEGENEDEDEGQVFDSSNLQVQKKKQKRRSFKYPNSVLHSWKLLSDPPKRPSSKIEE